MPTQPPIARKELGQHYLADPNIIRKIVTAIEVDETPIIEIGPGPGALTRPLLKAGASLSVIEKDERFMPGLKALQEEFPGQLNINLQDALQTNWADFAGSKVVGNLPYNVGTQIVLNTIRSGRFSKMIFMLQKEVILRITATPGTKDWGRLAIWSDLLTERQRLFDVAPGCFRPPPQVDSSVVALTPLPAPRYKVNTQKLEKLLQLTFTQRRKMLRASLKGHITPAEMESIHIKPTQRPEELTTEQLCRLSDFLS